MAIIQELGEARREEGAIEFRRDHVWRSPSWLSLLLLLVIFSPVAALAADLSEAYANGFRAFERGDQAAALQLWAPLAEQGDPRAQFGLGLIYETGLGGTAKDEETALGWYRRAARSGLSPAQNNLALMYAEGRVVPRDLGLAVALWRQAAGAGYGPAQLNLARALESGSGVERDEREAAEWRNRADAQRLVIARSGGLEPGREEPPVSGGEGDERPQREPAPISVVGGAVRPQQEPAPVAIARSEARPPPQPAPVAIVRSEAGPQQEPAPVAIVRSESRSLPPKLSTPSVPSSADAFYVQLASLRSHDGAVRFGEELSRLHTDLLAKWQPTVRTVDLGGKGVWHRVLFGPIQGRRNAAALCAQIQARVGPCLVAPAASAGDPS